MKSEQQRIEDMEKQNIKLKNTIIKNKTEIETNRIRNKDGILAIEKAIEDIRNKRDELIEHFHDLDETILGIDINRLQSEEGYIEGIKHILQCEWDLKMDEAKRYADGI